MISNKFPSGYKYFLILAAFLSSCKSGPFQVFKASTPHETYKENLSRSGLASSAIGKAWIDIADKIIEKPVPITIPYQEKGYFAATKVQAAAFSFQVEKGKKLEVKLNKKPIEGFMVFTDIWERGADGKHKLFISGDTLGNAIKSDISETGTYILRIQPELLSGGEYHLEITSGPSLDYPLKTYQNNQIRSIFGDGRDAGARKHEGIDIFSSFRTPLLAIAPGTVRVNENNLGGKVVWLRPDGKDYTIYYAHLDEQIVRDGQVVQTGDTLGRMGNTGNAKTTPPHLHFGIYTRNGAVDPLPYINPVVKDPAEIRAPVNALNSTMRATGNISLETLSATGSVKSGTIVMINAVSAGKYRVELPDGVEGYIPANKLIPTTRSISIHKISPDQQSLYDRPDSAAAVKLDLKSGQNVELLGNFDDYFLVKDQNDETGWIRK